MPLNITLDTSGIEAEIISTYTSKTHAEVHTTINTSTGEASAVTVTPAPNNIYTEGVAAIVQSILAGLQPKLDMIKADLDSTKSQIESMMLVFNTHTHIFAPGPLPPIPTPPPGQPMQ